MNPDRVSSLGEEFFSRIHRPGAPNAPSCLLFAFPKSGSVLLNKVFHSLCSHVGLAWVDIPGYAFWRGIHTELGSDVAEVFSPTGYCYGGWRYFPNSYTIPILDRCKSVLLVRDPRDMIVSHYFSLKHSHPLPLARTSGGKNFSETRLQAELLSVDDYALLWAPRFRAFNEGYRAVKIQPGVKTYRYEDVVFRKRDWVLDMLEHLGWSIDQATVFETVDPLDIRPGKEDVGEHVRQVSPGDHKRKLKPETIDAISAELADMISEYGY